VTGVGTDKCLEKVVRTPGHEDETNQQVALGYGWEKMGRFIGWSIERTGREGWGKFKRHLGLLTKNGNAGGCKRAGPELKTTRKGRRGHQR